MAADRTEAIISERVSNLILSPAPEEFSTAKGLPYLTTLFAEQFPGDGGSGGGGSTRPTSGLIYPRGQ